MISWNAINSLPYNKYTEFIEQPHGEGYDGEGEYIRGGGDDGGYDEQGHNDVATVVGHHAGIDDSHAAENPTDNGNLEDDAHGKAGHHQCVHIGVDGDGVGHHFAHLVSAKETEDKGEYEKVAKQDTKDKHYITTTDKANGILPFVSIEGRGDEVK